MKTIFKIFAMTVFGLFLSCQIFEDKELYKENEKDLVWVYIDFEIPMKDSSEHYHRFGQIEKEKYDKIKANEYPTGFLTVRNMRYLTYKDSLEIYEDESDAGIVTFRAEYIQLIELIKGDPILTYPIIRLTQRSLTQRNQKERSQISN